MLKESQKPPKTTQTYKGYKQRIGVIQWAVILSVVTSILAVVAYLLVGMVRHHLYGGGTDDRLMMWSIGIYQIMGMMTGIVITALSTVLYRRMNRLLDGLQAVADGELETYIPLNGAGEYKVLYETFNNMTKELKNTRLQQQNFMNEFSHEFKTPIHSIHGFADYLLHNDVQEDERKKYLRIIADESLRLSGLSQNTLLLSRLDTQELVMEKSWFRLDEQLRHSTILIMQKSEEKLIDINMQLDEAWMYGNTEMTEQIWLNLLDNAIKYTPKGGKIHVWLIAQQKRVKVVIRDTGVGMSEDTIANIFNRYYQGDVSHASVGYGLGLSIAKRIVDLCDGKISVESTLGKGTSFVVIFNFKELKKQKK